MLSVLRDGADSSVAVRLVPFLALQPVHENSIGGAAPDTEASASTSSTDVSSLRAVEDPREWLEKNGVEDVASSHPALPLQKSKKVEKVGKKRRRRLP